MSRTRRVLVLAAGEAWARWRLQPVFAAISLALLLNGASFVVIPAATASREILEDGFALALTLMCAWGLRLVPQPSGVVEQGHLPVSPAERRLAVLVVEEVGALAVALLALGVFRGLGVAPVDVLSYAAAAAFVVAAPLVVGGRDPRTSTDPTTPAGLVSWLAPWLLVAMAWVASGSALVAVAASLVWAVVPEPVAVADAEHDIGITPLVGDAAHARYRRRAWVTAAMTMTAAEVLIRVAPVVAVVVPSSWRPAWGTGDHLAAVVVSGLAPVVRSLVGIVATMEISGSTVAAAWYPDWSRAKPNGVDLVDRVRHLPIAPASLIDAHGRAILDSCLLGASVLAWVGLTGGLEPLQAVSVGSAIVNFGLGVATASWATAVAGVRAGDEPSRGSVVSQLLSLVSLLGLVAAMTAVSSSEPGSLFVRGLTALSVGSAIALVPVATLTWREARRRWTT